MIYMFYVCLQVSTFTRPCVSNFINHLPHISPVPADLQSYVTPGDDNENDDDGDILILWPKKDTIM